MVKMAIDNSVETWKKKIGNYCLKHSISYAEFARQSGVPLDTIKNITAERTSSIQLKNLSLLKKMIDGKRE